VLCLDSVLQATHGSPIGPVALMSHLRPSYGSFSGVVPHHEGMPAIIGQFHYNLGDYTARLTYLLPEEQLDAQSLAVLLETMVAEAGERGALNLLAEIDENHPAFESLRGVGFSVYSRQHIWRFSGLESDGVKPKNRWESASTASDYAVRQLYQSVVPPLIQGAEAMNARTVYGLALRQDGELRGFVESIFGPRGIYLLPVLHPDIEDVGQIFHDLLVSLPSLLGRPVYIAIRDYQSWLSGVMEDLKGVSSPRKALMVKHLVTRQRVSAPSTLQTVLEKRGVESTSPMNPIETKNN